MMFAPPTTKRIAPASVCHVLVAKRLPPVNLASTGYHGPSRCWKKSGSWAAQNIDVVLALGHGDVLGEDVIDHAFNQRVLLDQCRRDAPVHTLDFHLRPAGRRPRRGRTLNIFFSYCRGDGVADSLCGDAGAASCELAVSRRLGLAAMAARTNLSTKSISTSYLCTASAAAFFFLGRARHIDILVGHSH